MKYFWLQCKKLIRILPFTLVITSLLLAIALIVFSQVSAFVKSDSEARFRIDVVGDTSSRFFNVGVTALKTLDSSRFSLDFAIVDEETARKNLIAGRSSAYIVIPKGFIKAASYGKIIPISYYTTSSTVDISALMRDEITTVVSVLLKESQKAVFGEEVLLNDNGYRVISKKEINELNLEFIGFIVDRTKMYKAEITGVSFGLNIVQHIFIGFIVIFLCFALIPISCIHMRQDNSMLKMLSASGKGAFYTVLTEYLAMLAVLLASFFILVMGVAILNSVCDISLYLDLGLNLTELVVCAVPVAIMVCSLAFLVFEISGNLISAVTGYFFFSLGLCYISGCIYPLYALPQTLQKIASWLPTGVARAFISLHATGEKTSLAFCSLFLYTLVFLGLATYVRRYKLSKGEG